MNRIETNKELLGSIVWAGGIILLALVGSSAKKAGYLDSETVTRLVIGVTGLMIAWYGNRMPKVVVPDACARQARRIAGWSLTLSGLVYAALWAFAPFQIAVVGGCGAILGGMAVTFGFCLGLRAKAG